MKLREKLKNSDGSFDKKSLAAYSGLLFVVLGMVAVPAASQIQLYNGAEVKLNGGDIVDGASTVYDASAGQIATSTVDYTAATASDVGLGNVENIALSSATWTDLGISQSDISPSDVGLGNVENIALSTIGGTDISWDSTNNELDVATSSIQSGTTASDVGLENVENEAAVDESGDTMTGALLMSGYDLEEVADIEVGVASGGGGEIASISQRSEDSIIINSHEDVELEADENGNDGGPYTCTLDQSQGEFSCGGIKNWIHNLGNGSKAYYTSQESPEVRAVYEGQTTVYNGKANVSLPDHFSMTVSDSEPMLRAQATPHELATVAVTERTDDYLVIESSKDVKVDYRVTGVREGYEDKQVVRPKEE